MRIANTFFLFCIILQSQAQQIQYQTLSTDFSRPVDIATEPITPYLYIVEQDGYVKLTDNSGNIVANDFLNIATSVTGPNDNFPDYDSELGLLGMTFHPRFNLTTAPYCYVNYTMSDNNFNLTTVISRFTVSETPNQNYLSCDVNSEFLITKIRQPRSNHNGGDMAFGADGYLYIASGDGGGSNDPDNRAQNTFELLGKILRIDVDGDDFPMSTDFNYAIPPDNPFANGNGGAPEVFAYGLRNPWRFSFDKNLGDLWIADVGQSDWEEINFTAYSDMNSIQNYGWSCFEGLVSNSNSSQPNCPPFVDTTAPVFVYPHNIQNGGFSVTGGFVYRGCQYPALYGQYIFADYVSGNTWLTDANTFNTTLTNANIVDLASFGQDENGELYYVTLAGEFGQVTETSAAIDTIYIQGSPLSGIYQTADAIVTTATVSTNKNIEMKAPQCVEAQTGFEVDANANVLLAIEAYSCP